MELDFKTSLLREKFVLNETGKNAPMIALSNRLVLPLLHGKSALPETFVIRTQNMHSCVRFAAAIAKEFYERGPMAERMTETQWTRLWGDVVKGYEKDWNPAIWACVYLNGRPVFEDGARHPLLDIIEKCDAASKQEYDQSVLFAENAFQKAGKAVKITHDSNVALIVSIDGEEAKCGVILRGAKSRTTFTYTIRRTEKGEIIRVPTVLALAASFLEGVQLAFAVGTVNARRDLHLIVKYSDEDRKGRRSQDRLLNLTSAIEGIERKYDIRYRPERPDFLKMSQDAAREFAKSRAQEKTEA